MPDPSPEKWFASLNVKSKTIVLNKLMYELSLIIRDLTLISPFEDSTLRKLSGIGEMIHRITPYLIALNNDNNKRFTDEDLVELLFEMAESYELGGAFQQAWQYAASMALSAGSPSA